MECARSNKSVEADIDKDAIVGKGSYKNVYGGVYSDGPRKAELCVAKELREGPSELTSIFQEDLRIHRKAADLIEKFNRQTVVDKPVKLNMPEVWKYDETNTVTLIEPYIETFAKFNSNTGWVNEAQTVWGNILQALSHYSYHASGGSLLLCDLQGAIYDEYAVLTDPVIMSRTSEFGATDMGREGILNFFKKHTCNQFCSQQWNQPRGQADFFEARSGTSAVRSDGKIIDPLSLAHTPMGLGGAQKAQGGGLQSIPEGKKQGGMPPPASRPPRPPVPAWKRKRMFYQRQQQRHTHPGVSSAPFKKSPSTPGTPALSTGSAITIKSEKGGFSGEAGASHGSSASANLGPGALERKQITVLRRNIEGGSKKTWKARKVQ